MAVQLTAQPGLNLLILFLGAWSSSHLAVSVLPLCGRVCSSTCIPASAPGQAMLQKSLSFTLKPKALLSPQLCLLSVPS